MEEWIKCWKVTMWSAKVPATTEGQQEQGNLKDAVAILQRKQLKWDITDL